MWTIQEIEINNIISFKDEHVEFRQGVATLIFGKNEDNASQPCNGSGKSSLVEAIAFALTGEQLRKVKSVEEIINDSEEAASVFITLKNSFANTTFTIERTISRTAPQVIECHKYDEEGVEIEKDKTVQATVADYNRFILDEIGLSKDDLYNYYILCDNKYESFFDCSDKNKKEVINRFSNGYIVDESIERLKADMEVAEKKVNAADNEVAKIKGSISAIENELELANEKQLNAKQDRETRVKRIEVGILDEREQIEACQTSIEKAEKGIESLKGLKEDIQAMRDSDFSFDDSFESLKQVYQDFSLGPVADYGSELTVYKADMENFNRDLQKVKEEGEMYDAKVKEAKALCSQLKKEYEELQGSLDSKNESLNKEKGGLIKQISEIDRNIDGIESQIHASKKTQADISVKIAKCNAMLKGAVKCPKCGYDFFIESERTVDEVKEEISQLQEDNNRLEDSIAGMDEQCSALDQMAGVAESRVKAIDREIGANNDDLSVKSYELRKVSSRLNEYETALLENSKLLNTTERDIDELAGIIASFRDKMFADTLMVIERRVVDGEILIKDQQNWISFHKSKQEQLRRDRREILESPFTDFSASLKESLEKYSASLTEAENNASEVRSELDQLKEQEVNFNMFKSYLARKKIDALSVIVNDFLEKIGSDIRLKLEGFTMTKTGKLRDKISVQVMRDGIDCGSYHKFSGGEKARLNLACILSLHTLTNSSCDDGKGLDFLIIDELLDKSDEVGMATYCEALNKLGQTSLLITQGNVSEGYPHRLLVVKKQGVSTIN